MNRTSRRITRPAVFPPSPDSQRARGYRVTNPPKCPILCLGRITIITRTNSWTQCRQDSLVQAVRAILVTQTTEDHPLRVRQPCRRLARSPLALPGSCTRSCRVSLVKNTKVCKRRVGSGPRQVPPKAVSLHPHLAPAARRTERTRPMPGQQGVVRHRPLTPDLGLPRQGRTATSRRGSFKIRRYDASGTLPSPPTAVLTWIVLEPTWGFHCVLARPSQWSRIQTIGNAALASSRTSTRQESR